MLRSVSKFQSLCNMSGELHNKLIGGRFYALAVSTLDDVTTDELAAAPLKFIDTTDSTAPDDTRLP